MSYFSKGEKEEIEGIISGALKEAIAGIKLERAEEPEQHATHNESHSNYDESWAKDGVRSKLAGVIVAPVDLSVTLPDGETKTHFTFDEALAAAENLPDGWCLPTRSEWALLAEEFGNDPETGELDGDIFGKALGLGLNGHVNREGDLCERGDYGYYWSSVVYNSGYDYSLYFNANGTLNPQNCNNRGYGFSVRCVKEVEDEA